MRNREFTILDKYCRNRLHPTDRCALMKLTYRCTDMDLAVRSVYELAGR